MYPPEMKARFRAELVWACSDSFHAIVGVHVQQRCGVPCVVDLYDNFESYAAIRRHAKRKS